MFDLRYHAASLTAVFVAIAVGIVIGVAIASGGGVEDATRSLQQGQIDALNGQLEAERERAEQSETERRAMEDLVQRAYPALVAGRLAERGFAVLFVGPVSDGVRRAVERTLTDADSGPPVSMTAIELPIDVDAIGGLLGGEPAFASYVGDARLGELGEALAAELVLGGTTPLFDLLADTLVEQRTGALGDPVDGVVVARTWTPEEASDPAEEGRHNQSEALIRGLLDGLETLGVPAVGVETSQSESSAVPDYRAVGLSSVDNVESIVGRVALAVLLAGGEPGHYGTKETAEATLPPVPPLVPAEALG